MDGDKLTKQKARGDLAIKLLDNATLTAAFDAVSKQIDHEFHQCLPHDTERLMGLVSDHRALKRVRQRLHTFLNEGKIAEGKLNK